MSTTPPDPPPGYQPGDYVPFKDRGPDYQPTWVDPAAQVQQSGRLSPQESYRAIYGHDAPMPTFYASWGRRVLGYLMDVVIGLIFAIPLWVGYYQLLEGATYTTDARGNRTVESFGDVSDTTVALLVVGALISFAFSVYNLFIRQGRTGYSFGKTVVGIKLVRISTGEPIGAGMAFLRQLAHFLDSLACYVGWFWPLWDSRRQTFADKVMGTVVIVQPHERDA